MHSQVDFRFIGPDEAIPPADLIILPGSKAVRADLAFLRMQGWDKAIAKHLRYGGRLMGICGGFQMLGRKVHDPHGIEGEPGSSAGLEWLDLQTTLTPHKQLRNAAGSLAWSHAEVSGYEIHAGISEGPACSRPALLLDHGEDGAISDDGQVLGTYLHGIFDRAAACDALLVWAGLIAAKSQDIRTLREASIERLADNVVNHLDTAKLMQILEQSPSP
jgi:adenosylcobyric acid synthase